MNRKKILFGLLSSTFISYFFYDLYRRNTPIKIGILHSLTGSMASVERPYVDGALLAIEEMNAQQGLLGRKVEAIVVDGASDAIVFAQEAERLLKDYQVVALFGTYSCESRRVVTQVVERYNSLLFCPAPSGVGELSTNLIVTGMAANQKVFPALMWCVRNLGKSFFIIGNHHSIGPLIRMVLESVQAPIVGSADVSSDRQEMEQVVEQIINLKPDVILNMAQGDRCKVFFETLRDAGISSQAIPTMSFFMEENDVQEIGIDLTQGDYASQSYFQSVEGDENSLFLQAVKERYDSIWATESLQSAYSAVKIWAQTAHQINQIGAEQVMQHVQNQSRVMPEGIIAIDPFNHYTWKTCRIGKIDKTGQFDIIWSSKKAVCPVPFPLKTAQEWDVILSQLDRQEEAI